MSIILINIIIRSSPSVASCESAASSRPSSAEPASKHTIIHLPYSLASVLALKEVFYALPFGHLACAQFQGPMRSSCLLSANGHTCGDQMAHSILTGFCFYRSQRRKHQIVILASLFSRNQNLQKLPKGISACLFWNTQGLT